MHIAAENAGTYGLTATPQDYHSLQASHLVSFKRGSGVAGGGVYLHCNKSLALHRPQILTM
jgi:hypothetical protein